MLLAGADRARSSYLQLLLARAPQLSTPSLLCGWLCEQEPFCVRSFRGFYHTWPCSHFQSHNAGVGRRPGSMSMLTCAGCKASFLRSAFTNAQLNKRGRRKCSTCVVQLRPSKPQQLWCFGCQSKLNKGAFSGTQSRKGHARRCRECLADYHTQRMRDGDEVYQGFDPIPNFLFGEFFLVCYRACFPP